MTAPEKPTGPDIIRKCLKTLPDAPGVYRMLDNHGTALYVGKAKSLKKRVAAYTSPEKHPQRLQRMIAATAAMEFVLTNTEAEALLLESNLIKKLKPRYNILLRDDKSFPYILITGDHDFPLLTKHRGARKRKGEYYGPFAGIGDVNRTIDTLQKAFMLRNCTDYIFAQRTRPCLQYHIRRCSAPCVEKVDKAGYAAQVKDAQAFLSGKSATVQARLAKQMEKAAATEDYEAAAQFRDRIKALTAVQARQDINIKNMGDADVIGLYTENGRSCVQVFFFRSGRNYGNRPYYPRHSAEAAAGEILPAFIAQFYENKPVPPEVIVSHSMAEQALVEEALSVRRDKGRVKITKPERGARRRLLDFVLNNAKDTLARETLRKAGEAANLEGVAKLFDLPEAPGRIEIYDNSHISGTHMTGAMVVAGPEGLNKKAYRKFNIRDAVESDDYGMMREVMTRRFSRAIKENKGPGTKDWPDLLLIDGGKGQLSAVLDTLEDLGIADTVSVVSIAKGEDRNAGRETFFMPDRASFQLPPDDPVLHYLQRLRDEAHRFAIGAHRARRAKQTEQSPLDDIPGIGAARKRALLHHFGSARAVAEAGLSDLERVPGISAAVAQKIYGYFHED